MTSPTARFAERGERRIHTEAIGSGPAVVLIPGLGGGMKMFGTLPRRFSRAGLRAITFDPVGIPPSSESDGTYDFAAAALDLAAVIDAHELDTVDLVGTSLGGKVALTLAASAGDRIRRVVTLGSAMVNSARAQHVYRFFELAATHFPEAEFGTALAPFLFGETFLAERRELVADILRATRPSASSRRLMTAQARALAAMDFDHILAAVTQPVLCVAGAEDTLTSPIDVKTTAGRLRRGRFLLLERAGHTLLLEHADAFERTLEFLREDTP
jgi:4,5:9,10-diseco-3-hydroxy-5,9,17-trioxoandrosta-1(10),2-diene-4-oate hydrolase